MGPEKDIHSYAKRLFRRQNLGSVVLPSIWYYCKLKGRSSVTMPKDGNITKFYDTSYLTCAGPQEGKSIHIAKFVQEASVHIAAYLLRTYKRVAYTSLRKTRCFIFHVTARHSFTKKCKP